MTTSLDIAARSQHGFAIEAIGLTRSFGQIEAVADVSLRVEPGEVFGLLGPDGAGKSTLIRMLATVLSPDSGDARVFGVSVTDEPMAVKPRVGYMSQRFSLYRDLTVAENVAFFAELRGVAKSDRAERSRRALEFAGLIDFSARRAEFLSGGMKQKLALAVTLMHEPDLLLLDEPTTGVDPVSRREFWRIIADLRSRGITVLVATPYMDEAERCTRVAFMDRGHIRLCDTPSGVKSRVPGTLIELDVADERAALDSVRAIDGVRSVIVFGDRLRALVSDDGPSAEQLADAARAAGIDVTSARLARMDMEVAFAHLVETARADEGGAS